MSPGYPQVRQFRPRRGELAAVRAVYGERLRDARLDGISPRGSSPAATSRRLWLASLGRTQL